MGRVVCQLLTIFVLADFPQALLLAWIVLRDYIAHLQVRKLGNSLAGLSSKGVGIQMYASLRLSGVKVIIIVQLFKILLVDLLAMIQVACFP
jgi:hypothetical protein